MTEGPKAILKLGLRRMTLEDRVLSDEELCASPLVRMLGHDALRVALTQVTGRRYPAGGRLLIEGEPGESLLFLVRGEARVLAFAEGGGVEVGVARKGEVLGEAEALGEAKLRTFTAEATGDVEVLEFPPALVNRIAPKGSDLALHLREVAEARKAKRLELTDFFNRW